jgi:Tfp pilus assembly protein PilN
MTIFSSVTSFFTGKLRLYLEYALIALLIAVACYSVYSYITRLKLENNVTQLTSDVASANGRVDAVEQVNQQQQQALDALKGIKNVDSAMLQGLTQDLHTLGVKNKTITSRLSSLEKSNEAVRTYLESAVPAGVGCLLDNTCPASTADNQDANGSPAPAGSVASPVQQTKAQAVKD